VGKAAVNDVYDHWSSGIAHVRTELRGNRFSIRDYTLLTLEKLVLVRIQVRQLPELPAKLAQTFNTLVTVPEDLRSGTLIVDAA